jgi:hypothetical protein
VAKGFRGAAIPVLIVVFIFFGWFYGKKNQGVPLKSGVGALPWFLTVVFYISRRTMRANERVSLTFWRMVHPPLVRTKWPLLSVWRFAADRPRTAAIRSSAILASASLETFGCIRRVTGAVRARFVQAPEPCQKRGKVGSVKQRLLAELDAFEVTSFDRCIERSSADTEQVKCLADRVRCLRKTESTGVNRICGRVLVAARRILFA